MKNNLFKLTALLVVVVGLVSCREKVNVIGVTENVSNKTLQGCYFHTVLDSATMTTFKKECIFKEDSTGSHVGYYRTCRAGQGALVDDPKPFTWVSVMDPSLLFKTIVVTFEDGSKKEFKWENGILDDGEDEYSKSVTGLSDVDVELGIITDLENTEYKAEQKTFHKHMVDVPYLSWKTKVDRTSYLPADTAAKAAKYRADLEPYKDTIVWFLRTQVSTHTLGFVYLDTVINGADTTYEPINIVYVDPVPNSAGKHSITYLVSEQKTREEQVNDRPESVISSIMAFKRVGDVNTALYTYEVHAWSEKYYTDPTSPEAIAHDSVYSMNASAWMITEYTNSLKFDVLLFGKTELSEKITEGGTEVINTHEEKNDVYQTLNISGYSKKKGEATQAGLKYKLQ